MTLPDPERRVNLDALPLPLPPFECHFCRCVTTTVLSIDAFGVVYHDRRAGGCGARLAGPTPEIERDIINAMAEFVHWIRRPPPPKLAPK